MRGFRRYQYPRTGMGYEKTGKRYILQLRFGAA